MRLVPNCHQDNTARRIVRRGIAVQRLAGTRAATLYLVLRGGFKGTMARRVLDRARRGGDQRPALRLVR